MIRTRMLTAVLISLVSVNSNYLFAEQTKTESDKTIKQALPLDQLRNFSDIFARIKTDYVEGVSDKELLENAIRGMLSGLDPHSTYLDPEEYKELKVGTTGEFGGLGIQVGMESGYVKVISPIDDTPAFKAGIQAGDLIIRLNDKSVRDMSLNDAVKLMRGKAGTSVELTIKRQGVDEPLVFNLKRAIIKVKSVKNYLMEPGFAYVRISTFQAKTASHLEDAIEDLIDRNEGDLNGLIIDLRNNPGGVLNASADVSDLFIEEGKLVYTKGRTKGSYYEFNATAGDILNGAPIVVLINGGSASASEIVAGALQDHKRAVVMGEKSFGKGSVQTIQELRNGGAVKFTTARYFTPSGRSIQNEGIEPDILLKNMRVTNEQNHGFKQIKESDLAGHISNPNGDHKNGKKKNNKEKSEDEKIMALRSDYKIHEALNLLKGMHILSENKNLKFDDE